MDPWTGWNLIVYAAAMALAGFVARRWFRQYDEFLDRIWVKTVEIRERREAREKRKREQEEYRRQLQQFILSRTDFAEELGLATAGPDKTGAVSKNP